jgi:hypothetical protein
MICSSLAIFVIALDPAMHDAPRQTQSVLVVRVERCPGLRQPKSIGGLTPVSFGPQAGQAREHDQSLVQCWWKTR